MFAFEAASVIYRVVHNLFEGKLVGITEAVIETANRLFGLLNEIIVEQDHFVLRWIAVEII